MKILYKFEKKELYTSLTITAFVSSPFSKVYWLSSTTSALTTTMRGGLGLERMTGPRSLSKFHGTVQI